LPVPGGAWPAGGRAAREARGRGRPGAERVPGAGAGRWGGGGEVTSGGCRRGEAPADGRGGFERWRGRAGTNVVVGRD